MASRAPHVESRHQAARDEDDEDDGEVPALVFCAICGRPDCSGCADKEASDATGATPWETAGIPLVKRLWQTARLATIDGESFFGGLPDGRMAPALRFAFAAILSFALLVAPLTYALVPAFVEATLRDPAARLIAIGSTLAAVPFLAVLMVFLHLSWGLGLEMGLRVAGVKGRPVHCLRYALYSCGWDLVTSPFGFVSGCVTGGISGATRELRAAVRVPRFATRAYLGRARRVDGPVAARALVVAVAVTGTIVIGGAAVIGIGIVMAML
jgi:hypothetical protein